MKERWITLDQAIELLSTESDETNRTDESPWMLLGWNCWHRTQRGDYIGDKRPGEREKAVRAARSQYRGEEINSLEYLQIIKKESKVVAHCSVPTCSTHLPFLLDICVEHDLALVKKEYFAAMDTITNDEFGDEHVFLNEDKYLVHCIQRHLETQTLNKLQFNQMESSILDLELLTITQLPPDVENEEAWSR